MAHVENENVFVFIFLPATEFIHPMEMKNGDTVSDVCISYAGPEPEHIQKVNKDGSALYLRPTHYVVT